MALGSNQETTPTLWNMTSNQQQMSVQQQPLTSSYTKIWKDTETALAIDQWYCNLYVFGY